MWVSRGTCSPNPERRSGADRRAWNGVTITAWRGCPNGGVGWSTRSAVSGPRQGTDRLSFNGVIGTVMAWSRSFLLGVVSLLGGRGCSELLPEGHPISGFGWVPQHRVFDSTDVT